MKESITLFLLALLTSASVAQWSEQTSGVTTTLYSVSPVDNNIVWVCGASGKVLLTTNGGTNWVITSSPNASLALYNICGISATTALVTGSSSTTYVYKTTNSGVNWTQVFIQAGGFIDAITMIPDPPNTNSYLMYGDPVGGRWSFWSSTDYGSTWDSTGMYLPQAGSEAGYNNAMFFADKYAYWFGTNNTRVYHGHNGPPIVQPTPGQLNSLAIAFVDTVLGFVGGSTGLLYTSNGGNIWSDLPGIPGSGSINGIVFGDMIGELFLCRGTSIYRTTSFGVNWLSPYTQTGTYNHMQRGRGSGNHDMWAIRSNGGISKYTYPIGIKPISSEVPNTYTLYQNYPNPFNPETKIKFDIPKAGNVKLTVFDILGREITLLVNEQLKPGTYETEWNASNYPSGVYFYKLQTGEFTGAKKLMLIK